MSLLLIESYETSTTLYYEVLNATIIPTPKIDRGIFKNLLAIAVLSPAMHRAVALTKKVSLSLGVSFLKQKVKLMALSYVISPSKALIRQIRAHKPVSLSLSVAMVRALRKKLADSLSPSASFLKQKVKLMVLSVTLAPAVLLKRGIKVAKTVVLSVTASLKSLKSLLSHLSVSLSPAGKLVRQMRVTKTAVISLVASFVKRNIVMLVLSKSLTVGVSLTRRLNKGLHVSQVITEALRRQIRKGLSAGTLSLVVSFIHRNVALLAFRATVVPVGVLKRGIRQSYAVLLGPIAKVVRRMARGVHASVVVQAAIQTKKSLVMLLSAAVSIAANLRVARLFNVLLGVVLSAVAQISLKNSFRRILAVQLSVSAQVGRFISRSFSVVLSPIYRISKGFFRVLVAVPLTISAKFTSVVNSAIYFVALIGTWLYAIASMVEASSQTRDLWLTVTMTITPDE